MNQSQRNFLIDKIKTSAKAQRQALEKSLSKPPSLNNYLLHEVMSGTFELQPQEDIKKLIHQRALDATGHEDWTKASWSAATKDYFQIKLKDLFVVPKEYTKKWEAYREAQEKIQKQINLIESQADTLIVRITLASNATLESMIKEVDDMGDLKLMDTKLKALNK
jgi:hypothetical protein